MNEILDIILNVLMIVGFFLIGFWIGRLRQAFENEEWLVNKIRDNSQVSVIYPEPQNKNKIPIGAKKK